MMRHRLRIAGVHHRALQRHLFPGDGLEAVAFALCGRKPEGNGGILTVHKVFPVPHEACERTAISVKWKSDDLVPVLDEGRKRGMAVMKIHSHPGAFEEFSALDDESDAEVSAASGSWFDDDRPYASAVMLPDGRMFGRSIAADGTSPFEMISVAGDDLSFWHRAAGDPEPAPELAAQVQHFGAGTTARLRGLKIGVVGCSGTGSFVIEMIGRLAPGELLLVDHDAIEGRNLNRIVNSRKGDIGRAKADTLKAAVEGMGLGTTVEALASNLYDPDAVGKVAECDVVFGCMDTAEGRHLLNRIAAFYVVPYFDLGVHLKADGTGGIDEASGVVHYIQPGGSSLLGRGAYTLEQVRAEGLYRTDPAAYEEHRRVGYIEGVNESSPAVASLNATIASIAVNEFLARLHPYRSCDSADCEVIRFNFMETLLLKEPGGEPCGILTRHVGRGDVAPLLDMPSLSREGE